MQETPPNSPSEISIPFSRPEDGLPDIERVEDLDTFIIQSPEAGEAMLKHANTSNLLKETWDRMIASPFPEMDGREEALWESIARRLDSDRLTSPTDYDTEWLSAYYDRQIPADDPLLPAFEGQLANNPDANRILADLADTSEAVRRFACRMEEVCTLSLTSQIMTMLASDDTSLNLDALPHPTGLAEAEIDLLSAYADQALSTREMIDANRLTENNEAARTLLFCLNRLSGEIQSFYRRLEAEAPDLRLNVIPIISREIAEEAAVTSKRAVLPFNRKFLRFAVPTAAAIALIWLFFSYERPGLTNPEAELASVPGKVNNVRLVEFDQSSTVPDGELAVLRRDEEMSGSRIGARSSRHKTPSSEEYLFSALNENATAKEDVAVIFGQ